MFCSGTVVDHVGEKTWILTSATLVRKHATQFEAYKPDDIKVNLFILLLVCSFWLSPSLSWITGYKFLDCRSKWFCTMEKLL